ncbi:hypothetical protein [Anaerotignum sp.]|uniref:hypothetical protein n=1 Tax=Anaerotignum sp. TaxID=2039241 RepID=UPI0028AEB4D9|nr:hypothetical protein [Anaerotignum sp.]
MKLKNKLVTMLMFVLLFSFSPVSAFADEIDNPAPISISSGLVFDTDGQEATFDSSRMVYGEAVPCTQIAVTICRKDSEGKLLQEYNEDYEVGSLGIFSMVLPLELGTNYIEFVVNCENYDETTYNFEVIRKSQTVKEELKSLIALPKLIQSFR